MKNIIAIILSLCFYASKSQQIEAGVIGTTYFDIVPDTLLNAGTVGGPPENYYLDLNADGINDVRLSSYFSSSASHNIFYVAVNALNTNTTIGLGSISTILKIYSLNDTINNITFVPVSSGYLGYYSRVTGTTISYPQWVNIGDKYFAVKYQDSFGTAYGWVKVNCPSYNNCVVKEFSLGNQIIGIGETDKQEINLVVFPNPSSETLTLKANGVEITKTTLYNLNWQEIKTKTTNNYEYDVSALAEGMYFLKIETAQGILTKKVIVSR